MVISTLNCLKLVHCSLSDIKALFYLIPNIAIVWFATLISDPLLISKQ